MFMKVMVLEPKSPELIAQHAEIMDLKRAAVANPHEEVKEENHVFDLDSRLPKVIEVPEIAAIPAQTPQEALYFSG